MDGYFCVIKTKSRKKLSLNEVVAPFFCAVLEEGNFNGFFCWDLAKVFLIFSSKNIS